LAKFWLSYAVKKICGLPPYKKYPPNIAHTGPIPRRKYPTAFFAGQYIHARLWQVIFTTAAVYKPLVFQTNGTACLSFFRG
jgi:hypothetical protein